MTTDTLAPWEIAALKQMARLAVARLGKFEVAAMVAHRSVSTLHAYQDVRKPDCMPVDVLLRIERALMETGGEPVLVPQLARLLGLLCLRLPEEDGCLSRESAALLRETAEFAARHVEAMADGQICAAEAENLARAAETVHAISGRILAMLRGQREG